MLLTRPNTVDLFEEFDRAFNRAYRPSGTTAGWYPVDVTENDTAYVVEAELPGYSREQVSVTLEDGVLTIEADRSETTESAQPVGTQSSDSTEVAQVQDQSQKTANVHLHERRAQRVVRRFKMPSELDADKIQATLENGVLTLTLPKHEQTLPRQIEIR
ncbi:MAG: Hsp20/alpha crystallin family protein [Phycisphaeraceae bacterium]